MDGSAFPTVGHAWLVEEYQAAVEVAGDESVEVVHGRDVLPSRLAATDLAVGAVATAGGAALRLLRARAGRDGAATVDGRRVSASFRSDRHFRLDGAAVDAFAPLSGFWRTHDGWVRTHANYPHHRLRLLGALGLSEETTTGAVRRGAGRARRARRRAEARERRGGWCCGAVARRVGRPSAGVGRGGAAPRWVDAAGRRAVEISRRPPAGREPASGWVTRPRLHPRHRRPGGVANSCAARC